MHNDTMTKALEIVKSYQAALPTISFDFKLPRTLAEARRMADGVLETGIDFAGLVELERSMTSSDTKASFSNLVHLAVKLARSRAAIKKSVRFHASVILPAYGENIRMMSRGNDEGQDPNGEDFIVEKSKQLTWLFANTASTFRVFIVDDMSKADPISSGAAARNVIKERAVENFTVLFLEDGVKNEKNGDGLVAHALRGVEYPKNTRKAGAVYYGTAKAILEHSSSDPHVIVLTDCDLSVDIGQLGNLAQPILYGNAVAAAGSRRLSESILEIEAARNVRANTARYFRELLLKGLLPKDTQCGAKAFKAEAIAEVIMSGMQVLNFSFDIELLTKTALRFGADKIVPVAVAWFDSAELTTTDSSVHFNIMKAQLDIALANKTGSGEVFDQAVAVSRKLTADESVWLKLLDALKDNPTLLEKLQKFDTGILPELLGLTA